MISSEIAAVLGGVLPTELIPHRNIPSGRLGVSIRDHDQGFKKIDDTRWVAEAKRILGRSGPVEIDYEEELLWNYESRQSVSVICTVVRTTAVEKVARFSLEGFSRFIRRYGRATNQESVWIEVDGREYLVSDFRPRRRQTM